MMAKSTLHERNYRTVFNPGDLLVAMCSGEPVIYCGVLWRTMTVSCKKDVVPKRTKKRTNKNRTKR